MRKNRINLILAFCAIFVIALLSAAAVSAESVTIMGVVNDDYQIVTDDEQVYDVAETEKGDELVRLVNKRVKVTGVVEESEGAKTITVTAYEVIED